MTITTSSTYPTPEPDDIAELIQTMQNSCVVMTATIQYFENIAVVKHLPSGVINVNVNNEWIGEFTDGSLAASAVVFNLFY